MIKQSADKIALVLNSLPARDRGNFVAVSDDKLESVLKSTQTGGASSLLPEGKYKLIDTVAIENKETGRTRIYAFVQKDGSDLVAKLNFAAFNQISADGKKRSTEEIIPLNHFDFRAKLEAGFEVTGKIKMEQRTWDAEAGQMTDKLTERECFVWKFN